MEVNTPQIPVTQEVQSEVRGIPQTPPEPTIPTPVKPKNWLKIKILIILIILIGLSVGGFFIYKNISSLEKLEGGTQSILEIPESALKSNFGYVAGHNVWQQLEANREEYGILNLSWEKGMSKPANWQRIEPRKGEYHWEYIDRYVRTAQERDIQILFIVFPFTNWDQETCNLHLPYIQAWEAPDGEKGDRGKFGKDGHNAHKTGKPCNMEAYKEFLQRLVERYDGDGIDDIPGLKYPIRYWQIGTEVDMTVELQGSEEDYFEMLKESYITIKQTDPNAKVLISSFPTLGGDRTQFHAGKPDFDPEKILKMGASDYFDIMDVHDFDPNHIEIIRREFMERYGAGDKPIWLTEPGGIGVYPYPNITEKELALYFFQKFEDISKYGVARIFLGGGERLDSALDIAVTHFNYVKEGGNSNSFYDIWCGNKIVQEGEECETMRPTIGRGGFSARKPGTECASVEGMAAECVNCKCVYHETVCGDNIMGGSEECEIAWDCGFIRGMAPICEECKCVYHEGSHCGNDIPEKGEECETAWNCELIAGKAPTCKECKCVYHKGSYCGNDIPEEGEECERDFECDKPAEGFKVACEKCKCVQSKQ